mgnify:CR=1 FL=1
MAWYRFCPETEGVIMVIPMLIADKEISKSCSMNGMSDNMANMAGYGAVVGILIGYPALRLVLDKAIDSCLEIYRNRRIQ